jgi:hypothetical protein
MTSKIVLIGALLAAWGTSLFLVGSYAYSEGTLQGRIDGISSACSSTPPCGFHPVDDTHAAPSRREPTKPASPLRSARDMATKIRRLTPDEKQRIEKWALAKAQSERASDHVTVVVYGFTDDEGCAPYSIIRTEREAISPDEIPEERSET